MEEDEESMETKTEQAPFQGVALLRDSSLGGIVEIRLDGREERGNFRVSFTGRVTGCYPGNHRRYDAEVGQITIADHLKHAPDEKCKRVQELWDRWHLNDMRPGCEHQQGWRICPGHYDKARQATCSNPRPEPVTEEMLERAKRDLVRTGVALLGAGQSYRCAEDMIGKPCPICGYRFGHEWKYEPIPQDVYDELRALVTR